VASSGPIRNPVRDATGRHAHRGQPADVFFLAGTFGGEAERSCAVPAGRAMFFPAFTMWCPDPSWIPDLPDAFGHVFVDGEPQPVMTAGNGRETFEVRGALFNPVTMTRAPVAMRVWGIWALVPALPPGRRVVHFEGGDGHGFRVAATYALQIG
jgi:hypothetical protein